MAGHRFEIGEGVVYVEKRFPNGARRTELTVIDRFLSADEPQYRLRDADGITLCVLAESQLGPAPPAENEGARRLGTFAPGPDAARPPGPPWST